MSGPFARRLRVAALEAGRVRLEPAAPACEGCAACSGRCQGILSGLSAAGRLELAARDLPSPLALGDEVLLEVDAGALGRRAAAVYGLPLAGLVAGGLGALAAAAPTGAARDLAVGAGAMLGLLLGGLCARLIAAPPTPPYRFAPFPSPRDATLPCSHDPVS